MDAAVRRREILDFIQKMRGPVSAGKLAEIFGVSRQIIVGDIALLRAAGETIDATPRGYVSAAPDGLRRTVACLHDAADMERELYAIVDQGCTVLDVMVEHPIYGQLTGSLHLSSRYDVARFLEQCAASDARPLSALTEGIHLHTLTCPDEDAFRRVCGELRNLGFLLGEEESAPGDNQPPEEHSAPGNTGG